jgi:putative transposase
VREADLMLRIDEISDELWTLIEPVLPAGGHQGRPWNSHRLTLQGIMWRYRTGSPWRDVPDHFGAWQSIWERHRRWSDDGTYLRMFAAVREAAPEHDGQLQNLLSVDSTIVRAHQHSAGARHDAHTGGTIELQEFGRRAS